MTVLTPQTTHYPRNPRKITEAQIEKLEDSMRTLGDLSGIVHDLNSGHIISGNQRSDVVDINNCVAELVEVYDEPDAQGTVALGYVMWEGARYSYRQVRWTARQCEQANVVANRLGGDWDNDILKEYFKQDDLIEWGFQEWELAAIKGIDAKGATTAQPPSEFPAYDDDIETHYCCPKCNYEWSGKPR